MEIRESGQYRLRTGKEEKNGKKENNYNTDYLYRIDNSFGIDNDPPLLWMISTSFKIEGEVFEFPIRLIPRTLDHGAAVLMIEKSTVWQPHVLRHHHNNDSNNRTIEAIRDQIHDKSCYLPFFRTVAILSCKS